MQKVEEVLRKIGIYFPFSKGSTRRGRDLVIFMENGSCPRFFRPGGRPKKGT